MVNWNLAKKVSLKNFNFENPKESKILRNAAIGEIEEVLFNLNPKIQDYFFTKNYSFEFRKNLTKFDLLTLQNIQYNFISEEMIVHNIIKNIKDNVPDMAFSNVNFIPSGNSELENKKINKFKAIKRKSYMKRHSTFNEYMENQLLLLSDKTPMLNLILTKKISLFLNYMQNIIKEKNSFSYEENYDDYINNKEKEGKNIESNKIIEEVGIFRRSDEKTRKYIGDTSEKSLECLFSMLRIKKNYDKFLEKQSSFNFMSSNNNGFNKQNSINKPDDINNEKNNIFEQDMVKMEKCKKKFLKKIEKVFLLKFYFSIIFFFYFFLKFFFNLF